MLTPNIRNLLIHSLPSAAADDAGIHSKGLNQAMTIAVRNNPIPLHPEADGSQPKARPFNSLGNNRRIAVSRKAIFHEDQALHRLFAKPSVEV
jgi:hypothetical protein